MVIFIMQSQIALLGRNVSDVLEHLKNPLNEDILKDLTCC
jgi:hypothetical protein